MSHSIKYAKYLDFRLNYDTLISSAPSLTLRVAIVLPLLNEAEALQIVNSILKTNEDRGKFEIIAVINHSINASQAVKDQNRTTSFELHRLKQVRGLENLHIIELFDLEPKVAGVGHARKTGMDEALRRFVQLETDGLIVCSDGDCVVDPEFVSACLRLQASADQGFAYSFDFHHDLSSRGILLYELHLRYYMHALKWAGHPHSIYTVGSSMACTCSGYVQQGGMNERKAGEDFYFLQKFAKAHKWRFHPQIIVRPSGRASDRVPFGTGKAVADYQRAGDMTTYNFQAINEIGGFIKVIMEPVFPGKTDLHLVHPGIRSILDRWQFRDHLTSMQQRSSDINGFLKHFFTWFDAFKVMKMLHQLRDDFGFEDVPVFEGVNALFEALGIAHEPDEMQALMVFREMDQGK